METFSALLALCGGNSPVPVNSPHKGQWRGALMFSLICARINDWVNNREAGDLRRHRGHYDLSVMDGHSVVVVNKWLCAGQWLWYCLYFFEINRKLATGNSVMFMLLHWYCHRGFGYNIYFENNHRTQSFGSIPFTLSLVTKWHDYHRYLSMHHVPYLMSFSSPRHCSKSKTLTTWKVLWVVFTSSTRKMLSLIHTIGACYGMFCYSMILEVFTQFEITLWEENSMDCKNKKFNSLSPGRCGCDFTFVNSRHNFGIDILSIQVNYHPEWMPGDLVDGKSILIHVMAWGHQAASHHLNQFCPKSLDAIWHHNELMNILDCCHGMVSYNLILDTVIT